MMVFRLRKCKTATLPPRSIAVRTQPGMAVERPGGVRGAVGMVGQAIEEILD